MRSPTLSAFLEMRWEKLRDLRDITKTWATLWIPGEMIYLRYIRARGVKRSWVGPPKRGLESFLMQAFMALKLRNRQAQINQELYRTIVALTMTQSHKETAVTQKQIQQLLVHFWEWQRKVDPGAVRPSGSDASDMMQQMKQMAKVFEESSAGFQVLASDSPFSRKKG